MDYYKQKQTIAKADIKGQTIGKIEKWQAHRKGILHKGFTLILTIDEYYVIQHRKHKAFDGVFDLTFSSHQVFIKDKLQDTEEAVFEALEREWKIKRDDLATKPLVLGNVYYKSDDPKSEFVEHEIDEILKVKLKTLPIPNHDFAYGYSLVDKKELLNKKGRIYPLLAPWVKKMIEKKMI
jgi:isopentenyldiphosphate isomerase